MYCAESDTSVLQTPLYFSVSVSQNAYQMSVAGQTGTTSPSTPPLPLPPPPPYQSYGESPPAYEGYTQSGDTYQSIQVPDNQQNTYEGLVDEGAYYQM